MPGSLVLRCLKRRILQIRIQNQRFLASDHQERSSTDIYILLAALTACSASKDLDTGRLLHGTHGMQQLSSIYIANTLVSMYAKCGSMSESQQVFDRISSPTVVSWNALILGYADNGEEDHALLLLSRMSTIKNASPDDRTFVAALKACTNLAVKEESPQHGKALKIKSLEKGFAVHSQLVRAGFHSDIFISNTLLDMYGKCGSLEDARRIFSRMENHSVVSWTALMISFVENGEPRAALELFDQMELTGLERNNVTYVAAFKACGLTEALHKGMEVHSEAEKLGLLDSDDFVASVVVDMYVKMGCLVEAKRVFDRRNSQKNSLVSWNSLILGNAENGQGEAAIELFDRMKDEGLQADSRTFVAVLRACANLKRLDTGRRIHCEAARREVDAEIFVASSLVDMYSKCGSMEEARRSFDKALRRDVVLWTALLLGYVENGEEQVALKLFSEMDCAPNHRTLVVALKACTNLAAASARDEEEQRRWLQKGIEIHAEVHQHHSDDRFLSSALLDLYAKCGRAADAHRIFNGMIDRNRDAVCWTSLISAYSEAGDAEAAIQLFNLMREDGGKPDAQIFAAVLKACGSSSDSATGKRIHASVCQCGLETEALVVNSLLDLYGKLGLVDEAQRIFDSANRGDDSIAWTALIAAYGLQGDSQEVFRLFHWMQDSGQLPNSVTLLCVLAACSHGGLVEKGRRFFSSMQQGRFGVNPGIEHYVCLVDLLGRANLLDEALRVSDSMPFAADAMIWRTVLGACWKWKNVELGKIAFDRLIRLNGEDEAGFALMENIYGCAGLWWEQREIQIQIQNRRRSRARNSSPSVSISN